MVPGRAERSPGREHRRARAHPRGAGHDRTDFLAFRWSELLSVNLLLIYGMYFTMGYTLYFNLTWLPTYLKDVRGFSLQQAGWLSGVVLFTGGVATYVGGRLTDFLVKKYGLKIGRSMGVVTLPVAALLLVAAAQTQNPMAAAVLLAATLGVADLASARAGRSATTSAAGTPASSPAR